MEWVLEMEWKWNMDDGWANGAESRPESVGIWRGDDARPGNPNKTPKRSMFSITQARGRLQGGLYDITNTVGEGRDSTKEVKEGRRVWRYLEMSEDV